MNQFFRTLLKNNKGFSLTEVMVGGAILAGIGLAGSKMFRDQRLAQKNIENDQLLAVFHQGLIKSLSNTATCNATFKNWYNMTIPVTALSIFRCSGTECDNKKIDAGGIGQGSAIWAPNFWTDNREIWQINRIETVAAVASTGPVRLRVTYQLNPKLPYPKTVTRDMLVNVRFNNTGGFKECVNNQETSVNNLQNDICKSLNANRIDSTGQVAKWNEDTQSCEMVNTNKTCAAGFVIEGVRSDGSVHCAPATKNLGNDNSLNSSSALNCPSGTKMVFVGNKFEIVCN